MADESHHRRSTDDLNKKWGDHLLALVFGVLLAVIVGVPAVMWAGGKWVTRIEVAIASVHEEVADAVVRMEEHVTSDDARTASISATLISFDKTTTRIVVNQESLQARVDRLERNEDSRTEP